MSILEYTLNHVLLVNCVHTLTCTLYDTTRSIQRLTNPVKKKVPKVLCIGNNHRPPNCTQPISLHGIA